MHYYFYTASIKHSKTLNLITCWRLVSSGRGIGRIIQSDLKSHFETTQSHGNDSKPRKLGSIRIEAEIDWTVLEEKRSQYQGSHYKVILQHDNARPHDARSVKTYLETLKWEVLLYSPYSQDVAPSDYHLFWSMVHGLAHQHFRSYEEVKTWIDSWIFSNYASFFRDGIWQLPGRWKNIVASDGQYFES